jgi:ubiquitin-activating enzyme E1 C
MVMSLLKYDSQGNVDKNIQVPFIVDGGTEGFKGNARVIIPAQTACIECTLDLYPPQINYPLCTIANQPRLPEHCIEYVRIILWQKENPFEAPIDGDDPNHINWIYDRAVERANEFKIPGVTYRLTQGVVKHIIPAVASTNAVIAAACATEVFKIATGCCRILDNYMVFSDIDGIYSYTYAADRKDDCLACTSVIRTLTFKPDITLGEVITFLQESQDYQMKSPALTTSIDGKRKTLFMEIVKQTEQNKELKLQDLGVLEGYQINVADVTTPRTLNFIISYSID